MDIPLLLHALTMGMQSCHARLHSDPRQPWIHFIVEGFLFAQSPIYIFKFLLELVMLSFMWEVNQAVLLSWGTDGEINAPEPHPLHIKYDPCCQSAVVYCRNCFSIVSSLLHSELKEISFSPPAQPRHQHEKLSNAVPVPWWINSQDQTIAIIFYAK